MNLLLLSPWKSHWKTLNGLPIEQFIFIEITRKNIVKRAFKCLEDEDLKPRVTVTFIGEEVVDSGESSFPNFSLVLVCIVHM